MKRNPPAVTVPDWFWISGAWIIALCWFMKTSHAAPPDPAPIPGTWHDTTAPARIRFYADRVERAANWPGLGDFLTAVAWTESRGRSDVCNRRDGCRGNAARGWFQMRPDSARVAELGLGPDALFDEPTAVALAAWYAHRLRKYAATGQRLDWLALRRGWAYPSIVSDELESNPRSSVVRENFLQALPKSGLPASFADTPAFGPSYSWPGIQTVLAAARGEPTATS